MSSYIKIKGAREHNLKNIDIIIPKNKLIVITGLSGSGKSSLAFDVIYAAGQRKYVQSLSAYARQFLQLQDKPEVDFISGLSPAIAIDQKTTSRNPRSTVGTITEIHDYIRLLFARIGIPYSPKTGLPIKKQTVSDMVDYVLSLPKETKIMIMSPIMRNFKGEFRKNLIPLAKQGFSRIAIDGKPYELSDLPILDMNKKHTIHVIIDRVIVSQDIRQRITESIELALKTSDEIVEIKQVDSKAENKILSSKYSCPISGFQITEIEPRIFSFNTTFGACPKCQGLGSIISIDPELIEKNFTSNIKQEFTKLEKNAYQSKITIQILELLAKTYNFSLDNSFSSLSIEAKNILLYGTGDKEFEILQNHNFRSQNVSVKFPGIIAKLQDLYNRPKSDYQEKLSYYFTEQKCNKCNGKRLNKTSLCIKIDNLDISQVSEMNIVDMIKWLKSLSKKLSDKHQNIASKIIPEIISRLTFLMNVGLGYLTLSRNAKTLSGGESQRIRLASQIGSGLTGVLYILDEPSIGLHQRDNMKLVLTLKKLRDIGNTVIVIEHDEETILAADYLIDIGPKAGIHGGYLIETGTIEDIKKNKNSITGKYLTKKECITKPVKKSLNINKYIELYGARTNNLKNINIKIPLGNFVVVTGVSGSGKSTLILNTLYPALKKKLEPLSKIKPYEYDYIEGIEHIDKVININQSPIGRTPRSNPATYVGAFSYIRDWFTNLPESRARGYKVGRFSFNVRGGRCETCQGDGLIKIEMHFLSDVYVKCETCKGKRYNRETLNILYNKKSIADILDMTIDDALSFFSNINNIYEKIYALHKVGIGYITLGQSATTLSGGEAQRIKLAKELSRKATGKTLYILDEPTTGLHMEDTKKLLDVLHKLVSLGNTILVIEHNMDVIKTADYIIDIGPEGGNEGGNIVVQGPIQDVINCKRSITGEYLKKYL